MYSAKFRAHLNLQASLENLNLFDRELAEFLAWLGEMETSLERMEAEPAPNLARLREVRAEVRDRDRQFSSLTSRGADQLAAAGDSDIVLGSRWLLLQKHPHDWTLLMFYCAGLESWGGGGACCRT